MNERMAPSKMAEIYWNRSGRHAIKEVNRIIKDYENCPKTRDYWLVVKAWLDNCGRATH